MERSGDAAAAATARDRWMGLNKRDPTYLMVRAMMKPVTRATE